MKNKTQKITFGILLLFFACYFSRVFNFPNELIVVLGAILCLILVIQQKKLRIDMGLCFLTITMLSYYVICNGIEGLMYSIAYIPLVVYLLGYYAVYASDSSEISDKKIILLICILVLGYTLHGILNSYMWFAGYVVPGTRRWQDFWSGEIVPGTQHVAYFLPTLALFLPAVIYVKKKKILYTLTILLTGFFLYASLATRARMTIVIFVLVVFSQLFLYILYERKQVINQLKNKRIWLIITSCCVALIVIGIAVKDCAVMTAFIANLGKDGGILNNVRFRAQKLAVQQLFDYPMGGYKMDLGHISMAHNTWLDMANAAGLIPFVAFVVYTLYTLYEVISVLAKRVVTIESKLIIAGMYTVFFLYLAVEPAVEASIHLITPWIFLNGVVHGYLLRLKNRKGLEI